MRPSILNPLFSAAANLSGVGPKTAHLLDRLLTDGSAPARVLDLLFHLPYTAIDRRTRPTIAEARLGSIVTLEVKVVAHKPSGARSKAPYKVLVEDETGGFHGCSVEIVSDYRNPIQSRVRLVTRPGAKELDGEIHHETAHCFPPSIPRQREA